MMLKQCCNKLDRKDGRIEINMNKNINLFPIGDIEYCPFCGKRLEICSKKEEYNYKFEEEKKRYITALEEMNKTFSERITELQNELW